MTRPDLRVAAICHLYERGTVSLEKASELAGLNSTVIKRALHGRDRSEGLRRVTEFRTHSRELTIAVPVANLSECKWSRIC
jgi:Uncharacterised protein family (UPF0175)